MATSRELREAEESHRAAQAALGLAGAYLVLRDWNSVPDESVAQVATGWISPALRVIAAIRKKSRRLARRYYRLARAIETGRTLEAPGIVGEPLDETTLGELRQEYVEVLRDIARLGTSAPSQDGDESFFEEEVAKADPRAEADRDPKAALLNAIDLDDYIEAYIEQQELPDDTAIDVDDWDWGDEEDFDEFADALEDAIFDDVVATGERQIQEIDTRDAEDIDAIASAIDRVKAAAGIRAAGRVDRYGISAGRQEIEDLTERDELVQAVARGLGPNPCAFCAMLASRGFVYRDRLTAMTTGTGAEIRRYHDNCHCYPIVRWIRTSDLPPANGWLQQKWREVTVGASGEEARRVWRRWYEREGRSEMLRYLSEVERQTATV